MMANTTLWTVELTPDTDVIETCVGDNAATLLFLNSMDKIKQPLKIGVLASYLITMAVGLAGNALVIIIIAMNSQLRNKSVANYYIWNLAFSDLFFVLMMPLFCYATYCDNWPFGTILCKLSTVFTETNRYASMFTLVALSFDRYLASFYNMGHLRTVKAGLIACCVIWILCGTISIPYWIYSDADRGQCQQDFPREFVTFWKFFQLSMALVIPLVLICASYLLLAARLQMILKSSTASNASVQKPSRKMIRTILVVVLTFLICQVPWHAHEMLALNMHVKYRDSSCLPTIGEFKSSIYLNTVSTILVFISSCCNPIIYGLLNDNYRKLYRAVLCGCCNRRLPPMANGHHRASRPSIDSKSINIPLMYRLRSSCCVSRKKHPRPGMHHKLSLQSQDCTMYRTAITENIEMEDQSDEDTT